MTIKDDTSNENKQKKTRKVKRSAFISAFCATTSRVVMTKKSILNCFFFLPDACLEKKKGLKTVRSLKRKKILSPMTLYKQGLMKGQKRFQNQYTVCLFIFFSFILERFLTLLTGSFSFLFFRETWEVYTPTATA